MQIPVAVPDHMWCSRTSIFRANGLQKRKQETFYNKINKKNNPSAYLLFSSVHFDIWADLSTLCVSSIISASGGRRRMCHSSLEPPRRAASNGGSFILLRPLDAEIFNETSTIRNLTFSLLRHLPFRWIS